ncbi:RNA methyltransferase [archaeon SCG-AAA382B04]|nr:RNA methyltransferase [archaeon SCG-AAA382B04]
MQFSIILDRPKYSGNIGFIARVMKNFGFEDLVIVGDKKIDETAKSRASHAQDILDNVTRTHDIQEIIDDFDIRVATTGIRGKSEDRFKRNPYLLPKELKKRFENKSGSCGIFFGKEDHGLNNEVVKECEIVLSIPTSPDYPVMNLSHAVSIVLYELNDIEEAGKNLASREELKSVDDRIETLFKKINYPNFKKKKTKLILKRILGRATLTSREAHTLSGFFRKIFEKIEEE